MPDGATVKRPRGHQTCYSDQLAIEVCERISLGESLASVCRDPKMPASSSVLEWVRQDRAGFAAHYARARELQAERMADELVAMADSVLGQPGHPADHADVQAMRLAIDTRKWVLSKLLPKRYGDRLGVDSTGSLTIKIMHGLADTPDE